MKARMIFVRHGQSQGNLRDEFIGQGNSPLTELGHLQAIKVAEFLKDTKIDSFYASDLKRAFDTGCHIAELYGKKPIKEKRLREIFAGVWEGMKFEAIEEEYPESFMTWLHDIGNAKCEGGESVKDLYLRVNEATEYIAKKNMGKTVVIATHATPIRCLVCKWKGVEISSMAKIPWVANASVTIADYYEDGQIEIVEIDKNDFQGELLTVLPQNI